MYRTRMARLITFVRRDQTGPDAAWSAVSEKAGPNGGVVDQLVKVRGHVCVLITTHWVELIEFNAPLGEQ